MKRTLFIGDIHGCYDELVDLCNKMEVVDGDSVYATGDIIHGGPSSQKTVQFLRERNVKAVMGNHDAKFLECLEKFDGKTDWFEAVRDEFAGHCEDLEYLQSLPYWVETENFLLIHAGLVPHVSLQDQDRSNLTKLRKYEGKPWHEYYTGKKPIIYGHWAEQGLRFTRNTKGLDSGCVWGGHLTGYCLETGEVWQVRAHKSHRDYWKYYN